MTTPRRDIETRADCEALVRAFYARAMSDTMIGYLFTDVAHLDLDEHVPVITSFWETILLGAPSYRGGAFGPHLRLHARSPLRGAHFQRWLALWQQTVDELYAGPRAELAKAHAVRVANAFVRRLATAPGAAAPDAGSGGVAVVQIQHVAGRVAEDRLVADAAVDDLAVEDDTA